MRDTGEHRAAPVGLLVLLLPPLERPCANRASHSPKLLQFWSSVLFLLLRQRCGAMMFPFAIFTDLLPDFSYADKVI